MIASLVLAASISTCSDVAQLGRLFYMAAEEGADRDALAAYFVYQHTDSHPPEVLEFILHMLNSAYETDFDTVDQFTITWEGICIDAVERAEP